MAKLSPIGNNAQFINGVPATGAKLFFYAAGSSTKQTTYTDEAGLVPQTNPIILDSRGEPSQPIWLTEGLSYKVVFTSSNDTDPPSSAIWDIDNVDGINDASITIDQWVNSGATPLYVSPTQFTLVGDQTSAFQVNRRVKLLVTSGTVYGYITASVFGALTTVTVSLDSGALDSGLSSVQLGLLTPENQSAPLLTDAYPIASGSVDKTKKVRLELDGLTAATTRVLTIQDKNIIVAGLSDTGSKVQSLTVPAAVAGALTTTYTGGVLDFRASPLTSGTINTLTVASNNGTIPSGATLGVPTTIAGRIAVLEYYNAGTPILGWVNAYGGVQLDESNLVSPTTISAGSTSSSTFYSASAVGASTPYRVIGFFEAVNTAGAWSNPTLVQGVGGNTVLNSMGKLTLTSGVAVNTTSGTSIDFTGIPIGVKKITLILNGVSTNGTSNHIVRLGTSAGVEIATYAGAFIGANAGAASTGANETTGFLSGVGVSAANTFHGEMTFFNVSGNLWVCSGGISASNAAFAGTTAGSKTLAGTLDRIRLTTVGGADTFDAGSVNIFWE